jgi:hypothetical protein
LYIHRCHNGNNQRWKILRQTMRVNIVTDTFPEKMSWKIENSKRKVVCRGSGYSSWYSKFGTNCRLPTPHVYKVTCMDNSYQEGWGGAT